MNAQNFMHGVAGSFASQAEKTITASQKKELKCFGCNENHPWSIKQPDDTFKITCPNRNKPGVHDKAKAAIEGMKKRRKARKEERLSKRSKTSANTSNSSSTSTTTTTTVANSPGHRVVFVVQASLYLNSGADNRLPMPIQIMNVLPHVLMPLGPTMETANCPNINCAVDTCAGLNTGYYAYLMALAKRYPHCLYKLHTSREYKPIELSGIVRQGESAVTTSLDCTFQFYLPFQMRGTSLLVQTLLSMSFWVCHLSLL